MRGTVIGLALLGLLAAAPAAAVSFDDVLRMLDAEVSEEAILKMIDSERSLFVLSADDVLELRYAGASNWFINEMIERSEAPSRVRPHAVYSSYRPAYFSIGYVYDPFDYYFVTWPYYYAYVSPFRFSRVWWYYGGPVHTHWCHPHGWRVAYYDGHWGSRSVWSRGYRSAVREVPHYASSEKELRRAVYDRAPAASAKAIRAGGAASRPEERPGATRVERPARRYEESRPSRAPSAPRREPAWGRSGQPERPQAPSRPSVAPSRPQRGSASPPRVERPGRAAPPAAPARPAPARSPSRSSGDRPSRGASGR